MEITKVYPLDAVYDTPEDVPEDVCLILMKNVPTLFCILYLYTTNATHTHSPRL